MPRGKEKGTSLVLKGKVPWSTIERQFVQGTIDKDGSVYYPTVKELSDIHAIPYSSIRRKILSEGWVQKREKWQENLHRLTHVATMEEYIEAARKFDASCVEAAQKALRNIIEIMDEKMADGTLIDQLSLDRLGRAAVNWQRVGRLALGLSTENNMIKNKSEGKKEEEDQQETIIDVTVLNDNEIKLLESFTKAHQQSQEN